MVVAVVRFQLLYGHSEPTGSLPHVFPGLHASAKSPLCGGYIARDIGVTM
jgi:hypothetical protein